MRLGALVSRYPWLRVDDLVNGAVGGGVVCAGATFLRPETCQPEPMASEAQGYFGMNMDQSINRLLVYVLHLFATYHLYLLNYLRQLLESEGANQLATGESTEKHQHK